VRAAPHANRSRKKVPPVAYLSGLPGAWQAVHCGQTDEPRSMARGLAKAGWTPTTNGREILFSGDTAAGGVARNVVERTRKSGVREVTNDAPGPSRSLQGTRGSRAFVGYTGEAGTAKSPKRDVSWYLWRLDAAGGTRKGSPHVQCCSQVCPVFHPLHLGAQEISRTRESALCPNHDGFRHS